MAKMRAGIEIPIIPEDFVASEEELSPDMLESFLQWVDRRIRDEMDPADLTIPEAVFSLPPKR